MTFDTNGISYNKIAMGKIMAWSVPPPKENQMFLMEPSYLIDATKP